MRQPAIPPIIDSADRGGSAWGVDYPRQARCWLLALLIVLLMLGCGHKGALYLPPPDAGDAERRSVPGTFLDGSGGARGGIRP